MKLVTVFEQPELTALQSGVVVEGWKHIGYGRGKRLFESTFTTEEQEECRSLYKLFLRWYSGWHGTGVPQNHTMTIAKYELAKRLCNFFGAL